jgi:hypothetical protein
MSDTDDRKIRRRPDGRRSLLVYMDEDLIKDLKKAALDEDCNAYEIVEAATRKWLDDRKVSKG